MMVQKLSVEKHSGEQPRLRVFHVDLVSFLGAQDTAKNT
jgi:hypothetical protein